MQEGLRAPLEIEPGEFVAIDGAKGEGAGIQVPRMSSEWLDGLWVLENMPDVLDEYSRAELAEAVRPIRAAKCGMVPVVRACRLYFEPMDNISEDDKLVAKGVTEGGMVLVPGAPVYEYVPLEGLTPTDVDEELLYKLEFHVSEGPETMGPYVIEDTPRAREAVRQRLGD